MKFRLVSGFGLYITVPQNMTSTEVAVCVGVFGVVIITGIHYEL